MQMMTGGLREFNKQKYHMQTLVGREIPLICMSVGFRARWSDLIGINYCLSMEHSSLTCWIWTAGSWADTQH